jgi:glycosyltransferase involved in cell wall biosynthesis
MDGWADSLNDAGANVLREPLIGLRDRPLRFIQAMFDLRQQRGIADVCRSIEPLAILVNQQYDEDGLDYLMGALNANIAPVASTLHMPMTHQKGRRPIGHLRGAILQQWYRKHPYQILVVSKGSQLELENYYRLPIPSKVVHLGCPVVEMSLDEPTLPETWRTDIPTIGFCGQFVPQKNMGLLIDSWVELTNSGTRSQLLLVGDGPLRRSLEIRLNSSKNADWHITGWQDRPERYLPFIDVYAMSSITEGLPLALVEAVGKGIPSVTTAFNGAHDVAEHASWAKVSDSWQANDLAATFRSTIQELPALQATASSNKQAFRSYFSLRRMALDTVDAILA